MVTVEVASVAVIGELHPYLCSPACCTVGHNEEPGNLGARTARVISGAKGERAIRIVTR
jgi:hypothetical protein